MRMRISALALGTLLALGCGSPANRKLDEIADRACACADAACAKKIGEELAAWMKEYEGARGDQGKAEKSFARAMSCLMKTGSGDGKVKDAIEKADRAPGAAPKAAEPPAAAPAEPPPPADPAKGN